MRYLFVLLLAGCASGPMRFVAIDYSQAPPEDWPRLRERVIRADKPELARLCKRAADSAEYLWACAHPDFAKRECVIYVALDSAELLEHERAHCRGYDHAGTPPSASAAAYWMSYKESLERPAAEISPECRLALLPEACMRERAK